MTFIKLLQNRKGVLKKCENKLVHFVCSNLKAVVVAPPATKTSRTVRGALRRRNPSWVTPAQRTSRWVGQHDVGMDELQRGREGWHACMGEAGREEASKQPSKQPASQPAARSSSQQRSSSSRNSSSSGEQQQQHARGGGAWGSMRWGWMSCSTSWNTGLNWLQLFSYVKLFLNHADQ